MNIKTWAERAESLSDDTVVTSLHLAQFRQAEIDELRTYRDNTIECLRVALDEVGTLRAENERLRAALTACMESTQYAWGCIENVTVEEEAKIEIGLDAARAALGEK